jgi:hypothetical protein
MPRWWKKMARTDAQQPTAGGIVPYLRMTEGEGDSISPHDLLFDMLEWHPVVVNKKTVQEAVTFFEVVDDRTVLGNFELRLTYDESRTESRAHPALWIHWGDVLRPHLEQNSREGWYVVVQRNEPDEAAPTFTLTFQRTPPA